MTKKYWLVLLIAMVAVIFFVQWKGCRVKKETTDQVQQVIKNKQDTARKWIDPAGREHAEKEVPEVNVGIAWAAYARELDSIKALLRIKDRQILAFTGLATSSASTVIPEVTTVITGDTCRSEFSYSDRWIDLTGKIGPKSSINYQVRDSLILTTYTKKAGMFSPASTYIDVFSLNPHVRVTGLSGFRVPVAKPGRFGIGPFIGYGYSFNRWAPAAGISLHYSLIRF